MIMLLIISIDYGVRGGGPYIFKLFLFKITVVKLVGLHHTCIQHTPYFFRIFYLLTRDYADFTNAGTIYLFISVHIYYKYNHINKLQHNVLEKQTLTYDLMKLKRNPTFIFFLILTFTFTAVKINKIEI